jgi:hypothetical protein
MPAAPPELGRLVDVLSRRYVVFDVARGELTGSPLRTTGLRVPQYLVDDALGEELHVVWEYKPGAIEILPSGGIGVIIEK